MSIYWRLIKILAKTQDLLENFHTRDSFTPVYLNDFREIYKQIN
ncbi:hypothetical protein [Halobacillus sp. Marseille-Q1614]|nr:hypothetical protein [Halobacillus sp. Marseille-Q1614]